jgi:UDP-2,3-diacylglucosamine pyrophosphatase LpxH
MDNSQRFLESVFFPFLDRNGIRTVIHLGDVVDRRKYVNINTAKRLREDFLDKLNEKGYDVHFIAGNHDTYYKNTNSVNSLQELVEGKYPFHVYDQGPVEVEFEGTPILFIPWICDDNRQATMETMRVTKATIAMGHLEIQGFEMYKGSIVSHGDDASLFDRFDMVMSGHYHHRSSNGHIWYLGSHAEFTWSDYNDPRGFHIFDTETRELTFVQNPYKMFEKVWYNDADENFINQNIDYESFTGKILKVIVTNKTNPYWFDKFIENIEKFNPLEIQIVEDHLNLSLEEDDDIINEAESTITIFKKYIESIDIKDQEKIRLEKKMVELYNEALTIE